MTTCFYVYEDIILTYFRTLGHAFNARRVKKKLLGLLFQVYITAIISCNNKTHISYNSQTQF